MRKDQVIAIVEKLNDADVRYLVAGGLAVVAHGYLRYTADIDLVIQLERDNLLRAIRALTDLGYKPRLPVNAEDFADPELRRKWIVEKHMIVFSMFNTQAGDTTVDLFVEIPFDFDKEYEAAAWMDIEGGPKAPVVSFDCLMAMKGASERLKDKADIESLQKVKEIRDAKNE